MNLTPSVSEDRTPSSSPLSLRSGVGCRGERVWGVGCRVLGVGQRRVPVARAIRSRSKASRVQGPGSLGRLCPAPRASPSARGDQPPTRGLGVCRSAPDAARGLPKRTGRSPGSAEADRTMPKQTGRSPWRLVRKGRPKRSQPDWRAHALRRTAGTGGGALTAAVGGRSFPLVRSHPVSSGLIRASPSQRCLRAGAPKTGSFNP